MRIFSINEFKRDLIRFRNVDHYKKERERVEVRTGEKGNDHVYTLKDFADSNCIFIHIPRAAGNSISAGLFGHSGGGHRTAQNYRMIFGRRFWTYYKFAFVRNPYTRLVSAYEYLRRGGHPAWPENRRFGAEVIGSFDEFSEFVLNWLHPDRTNWPQPHFYPQTHFLELDGEPAVDFIGCVERIEEDFKAVCDELGKECHLPKKNETPGEKRPLGSYFSSDAVIQRVQKVYRSDFDRLGYSREIEGAMFPPRHGRYT